MFNELARHNSTTALQVRGATRRRPLPIHFSMPFHSLLAALAAYKILGQLFRSLLVIAWAEYARDMAPATALAARHLAFLALVKLVA